MWTFRRRSHRPAHGRFQPSSGRRRLSAQTFHYIVFRPLAPLSRKRSRAERQRKHLVTSDPQATPIVREDALLGLPCRAAASSRQYWALNLSTVSLVMLCTSSGVTRGGVLPCHAPLI